MTDEQEAREELGRGNLYGALLVPADFTSATTALTDTATAESFGMLLKITA